MIKYLQDSKVCCIFASEIIKQRNMIMNNKLMQENENKLKFFALLNVNLAYL